MKKSVTFLILALIANVLVVFTVYAAANTETAQIIKSDSLREKPFADAHVITVLATKQSVDIIGREGAWYHIRAAGKKGWVRMLSVRKTSAATTASAGSLSAIASGRTGTGNIVATTGIRGLNEENLAQATYSETAISEAETFRVSADEASRFAAAGKLKTRSVPVLPASGKGGK